jgi:hypothetical protein
LIWRWKLILSIEIIEIVVVVAVEWRERSCKSIIGIYVAANWTKRLQRSIIVIIDATWPELRRRLIAEWLLIVVIHHV